MMSLRLKKAMSLMIAFFVAFGIIALDTGEVSAASGKWKVNIQENYPKANHIYVGEDTWVYVYNTKSGKAATVKSVKSSNKSVAKVKKETFKEKGKKYTYYYVIGKKAGKAKVTVKYKYGKKTTTKKVTVTVHKYPNHVKSLTVNGKNIKVKGKNPFRYGAEYSKSKTKVNIKIVPSKGWEIVNVYGDVRYVKNNESKWKEVKGLKSKVKKGTDISFAKKYKNLWIVVDMENSKGTVVSYIIELYR